MLQAFSIFLSMAMPGFHALILVALSVISIAEQAGKIYSVIALLSFLSSLIFVVH